MNTEKNTNNQNITMKAVNILFLFVSISIGSIYANDGSKTDSTFQFLTSPYLQNLNDSSVTIMWLTNRTTKNLLEFGETAELGKQTFYSEHGLISLGSPAQKVLLTALKPETRYYYRAVSIEITDFGSYKVIFGDTLKSEIYSFITPNPDLNHFSFLAFNDVHDRPDFIKNVIIKEGNVDFIAYLGDIMGHIESSEKIISNLLKPSSEFFASETPFFYVRGNHEARGSYAREFIKYIHNPDEHYYYCFNRGPVFFVVLDCGEDKPDDHPEYSGLVDFDAYRSKQSLWLQQVINSREFKESRFQIVLSHFPLEFGVINAPDQYQKHGREDVVKKFGFQLNNAGADLWLCGHTHRYKVIHPSENNAAFPVVVGGGHTGQLGSTYTRVDFADGMLTVTLKATDGSIIESFIIE
jgi:acid phosphatase type 7